MTSSCVYRRRDGIASAEKRKALRPSELGRFALRAFNFNRIDTCRSVRQSSERRWPRANKPSVSDVVAALTTTAVNSPRPALGRRGLKVEIPLFEI
ncbi:hypothetical protein EVAR_19852_1 [Eumeta japonica]|uniref:Uncharacterized protein n=1 Tax=Eumeta variegata TaxID=151549 RepID=A0A4C1US17_EUMVA|nr:hypothetical protein EVAR_19852_1 [Eumeta japonica]